MVIQEFYQQGDAEAANKLPITPSMDRNRSNPIQISVQFNDFIARPYFEALADILGGRLDEVFVDVLVENRARWLENSQGMDLMMNDSSSSVDLAGGEASLAATESSGGIVTGDESTNNEDMAEQTTTTDSSTPIRARCSSSSTDSLKYADIEGDDVYSSVPMSYPIRLGSVGAIKLKPPAPIYESASSLETGSHDSVSTYPQLIFQAAASSTASGGSVSGLFLDRKQPLQRHHPHQHAGSTHSSNPSSTTTASPSTTITTPSSSTHHRGRRLSIAAGTIEIPERFVQKSPQSTRLKQRSLSHGRTSGVSISSLSSSDAIVALTAAAAAAAASSGGGGAASSRGSLSTTPPTTVITTTSDGEQRKNSESS